jgi:hypothetical protein
MRKAILFSSCVIVLGVLAGCSNNGNAPTSAQDESTFKDRKNVTAPPAGVGPTTGPPPGALNHPNGPGGQTGG